MSPAFLSKTNLALSLHSPPLVAFSYKFIHRENGRFLCFSWSLHFRNFCLSTSPYLLVFVERLRRPWFASFDWSTSPRFSFHWADLRPCYRAAVCSQVCFHSPLVLFCTSSVLSLSQFVLRPLINPPSTNAFRHILKIFVVKMHE